MVGTAGSCELDCVVDLMERGGMSDMYWTRDPFEQGAFYAEVSRPALAEIGLHLFPGDFDVVRAALERLKGWSDERYDRGRDLCRLLGRRLLIDARNAERKRALGDLLGELDRR